MTEIMHPKGVPQQCNGYHIGVLGDPFGVGITISFLSGGTTHPRLLSFDPFRVEVTTCILNPRLLSGDPVGVKELHRKQKTSDIS